MYILKARSLQVHVWCCIPLAEAPSGLAQREQQLVASSQREWEGGEKLYHLKNAYKFRNSYFQ